ncbi:hypothetical protein SPI_06358 [Niveomyces insectorum RCEF 264]|uniref:Uncharacterized protein n=1 Tax=Niveomyces insectorum RCEF 264 TaxID=1081102 RepID=A0A167S210_9HYPO|nr:hypothetical protein SPI_06358 [Niveomyces insectorum RCEF 264]
MQCEEHPGTHDAKTFDLPNRANVPCAEVVAGKPCKNGINPEQATGELSLGLICPHCVNLIQRQARKFFFDPEATIAYEEVRRFNKHAKRLLNFALDCILVSPTTGEPIADADYIDRKMNTLEKKVLKWDPNMGRPGPVKKEKIRRWAWDEPIVKKSTADQNDSDDAGEGSSSSGSSSVGRRRSSIVLGRRRSSSSVSRAGTPSLPVIMEEDEEEDANPISESSGSEWEDTSVGGGKGKGKAKDF